MIILGLTGSIGMGKTVAADTFRRLGVPVHDADLTVHQLMAPDGKAFDEISRLFPDVIENGAINRRKLGDIVFVNPPELKKLENILHPQVKAHKHKFLATAARRQVPLVVLDVPLLFEGGGQGRCDGTVVVTAPAFVQRARVLARSGMTVEKFQAIRANQLTDAEKRKLSTFVVQTGNGRLESLRMIRNIITETKNWQGRHWPPVPDRFCGKLN